MDRDACNAIIICDTGKMVCNSFHASFYHLLKSTLVDRIDCKKKKKIKSQRLISGQFNNRRFEWFNKHT